MAYFRKRGNTWSFTVDIGRDPLTQERKQKTITGFVSEPAARIACDKFLSELEQGKRPDNITLGVFIIEFLENEVKHKISESSYINQFQWARDYIIPKLGKNRVDRLTHSHIVKFYNALLNDGEGRATIKNVAMVLSKTMKAAVVWGYAIKDVTAHATPPSYKPGRMKIWTEEEMKDFMVRSESMWLHTLYCLALTSGMRRNEMLGLNWSDIDFKSNTITIDKALKYTPSRGMHIKDPKTPNSFRNITIPQFIVDKLDVLHQQQPPGINIVFDNGGLTIHPTEASRTFLKDCKKLNMNPIRFHDMRHTHASHLLKKYNIKVVAERLGDTALTVLTTYAHVLPSMQQSVADGIDDDWNSD